MKKILALLLFVLLYHISYSQQQINVVSFDILTNDMDARINEPKLDQNGEKCAIIKVVTGDDGFVWEGGTLGIVDVVNKTGEYWLYVPRGAKRLTIKHDQLGVLRNYNYPVAIREAEVYEMKISAAKVITILDGPEINTGFVVFNSTPEQADVYIDDIYMGQTPLSKELKIGKHNYRIEKHLYHPDAGQFNVLLNMGTQKINRELKPKFGFVKINSLPENGAQVYVDDVKTDLITPCTIDQLTAGRHIIHLRHEWYEPEKTEVMVEEGQTSDLNITMTPAYGTINVSCNPSADIFIDNIKMGSGNYTGKLRPGFYQVEARLHQHRTQSEKLEIKNLDEKELNFTLIPIKGALKVKTTPIDVNILVGGKLMGKSPIIIPDILVGTYTIELKKEGYKTHTEQIAILENEVTSLTANLAATNSVPVGQVGIAAVPAPSTSSSAIPSSTANSIYKPQKATNDQEAVTIAEEIRRRGIDNAGGSPPKIQEAHKNANKYIEEYLVDKTTKIDPNPKQNPKFQGGDLSSFKKYIEQNILYPDEAKRLNIQGRVSISFTINHLGYVSNVKVVRGSNKLINVEAIRVIESSPRWQPAMKRGVPVNVRYSIPVYFDLD